MYVYVYAYMHCMCVYVGMCMCMHICACVSVCVCVCVSVFHVCANVRFKVEGARLGVSVGLMLRRKIVIEVRGGFQD